MNFFQEQERARQHTLWLVGIFGLAVAILILITIAFLVGLTLSYNDVTFAQFISDPWRYLSLKHLYMASIAVVMVVFMGSLYKYMSLSSGGKVVAEALGGRKLNRNQASTDEQKLLNVVEEMAIASGISVPTVYLLSDKSINAFAAGLNIDDAVIGITEGAVEKLSREELQGVIAHEFSHIFNGDMRLNLQLTAILHGILLIGLIGEFMMRSSGSRRSYSHSHRKNDGGANLYFIMLGVGLMIIGYVGTFFGSIIKANVSRKREYLADATAVQYTRYPYGISGALKKIAYYSSTLHAAAAEEYSHLYFSEGVSSFLGSLLATHPPLEDRIKKIEPRWSGKFPDYSRSNNKRDRDFAQEKLDKEKAKEERKRKLMMAGMGVPLTDKDANTTQIKGDNERKERFVQGAIAAAMMQVGQLKEESIEEVQDEIAGLDPRIVARLNEPLGAQAIILSLLYNETYKERLYEIVKKENPYLLLEFASFNKEGHKDLKAQSALIVSLSLSALKSLSIEQYQQFKKTVEAFVQVDNKVTLFEWSLQYIIQRPLELHLGLRKVPKRSSNHLGAIKAEVEVLYSMLAQAQYESEEEAQRAFDLTKKAMKAGALKYIPRAEITQELFLKSVYAIEQAKPAIAERIFEGVLYCIRVDGKVSASENVFVHAVAQLMQVPLPREFKVDVEKRENKDVNS